MFDQRVLTAVVLAPLVVAAVVFLSTPQLAAALALVLLVGAWEWSRLSGLRRSLFRAVYVAAIAVLIWLCWRFMESPQFVQTAMYVASVWWVAALVWIFAYRPVTDGPVGLGAVKAAVGVLVLIPAWIAVVGIHAEYGPYWVLFVLVLMWVADSGAYFVGRAWGHNKLIPRLSPGKTREGVYGALVFALVYTAGAGLLLELRGAQLAAFVALGVALVPVSIIGDLFESLIKRLGGFKDSGSTLPGHGGILDRIDSLTASAPLFFLGLLWMKASA